MSYYNGKVVVVTGAGGVLCSVIAKAYAEAGAKVALLDLNLEAAEAKAKEITDLGYIAKGYKCNVLQKESIEEAHQQILADLGTCDILINGAGGNNPRATTDNEYAELDDATKEMKTFFDLDKSGVEFVFNLNFIGTLLPSQVFASDMIGREGCSILNISSMNAYTPLTKIPAYSGAKAAVTNFTQWLAVHFSHIGIRVNAIAPGFFSTKQNAALLWNADGTPTARTGKILAATPMGKFGEIDDLVGEIKTRIEKDERVLVTTLTIRMAEELTNYLKELDIKVAYLHSEVKTLERLQIIHDLRIGKYDVVVGINLLREGIDIPEVSLIAILDADKEGFLRSNRSLIQTAGRCARNANGHVIMYGDKITDSMKQAIDETARRRNIQEKYNEEHGITPKTISKEIREVISNVAIEDSSKKQKKMTKKELAKTIEMLEQEMKEAAKNLDFERAMELRDILFEMKAI